MPRPKKSPSPFRYFNSSPGVIRLAVLMYVRFPLSLRNVEDLLAERGIEISQETVRYWWNRFGPMFAADIRRQRGSRYCQSKCTEGDYGASASNRVSEKPRNFAILKAAISEIWRDFVLSAFALKVPAQVMSSRIRSKS
jgi:putative transposase